jgi:hypothetical protein
MSQLKRFLFSGTAIHRLRFARVQLNSTTYAPVFGWVPA